MTLMTTNMTGDHIEAEIDPSRDAMVMTAVRRMIVVSMTEEDRAMMIGSQLPIASDLKMNVVLLTIEKLPMIVIGVSPKIANVDNRTIAKNKMKIADNRKIASLIGEKTTMTLSMISEETGDQNAMSQRRRNQR